MLDVLVENFEWFTSNVLGALALIVVVATTTAGIVRWVTSSQVAGEKTHRELAERQLNQLKAAKQEGGTREPSSKVNDDELGVGAVALRSDSSCEVERLDSIGRVREAFARLTGDLTGVAELYQTFVANSYITPRIDFIDRLLKDPSSPRPALRRFFVISRPLDLHFAAHSLEAQAQYGAARMSVHVIDGPTSTPLSQTFVNFTVAGDDTVVTFPARIDRLGADPEPFSAPDSEDLSTGLLVRSSTFSGGVRHYLDQLATRLGADDGETILGRIKDRLWEADRAAYLKGLGAALVADLMQEDGIKSRATYLGIVGSTARHDVAEPRDLDLVLAFSELEPDMLSSIKRTATDVCRLFSTPEVRFRPEYVAGPVKRLYGGSPGEAFPIQILINDERSMGEWSLFIAWSRQRSHLGFRGSEHLEVFRRGFTLTQVVSQTLGIRSCRRVLSGEDTDGVPGSEWITENGQVRQVRRFIPIQTTEEFRAFLWYSMRWAVVNLACANDSPLKPYGRTMSAGKAATEIGKVLALSPERVDRLVALTERRRPDAEAEMVRGDVAFGVDCLAAMESAFGGA